jgi:ribosomal protein L29
LPLNASALPQSQEDNGFQDSKSDTPVEKPLNKPKKALVHPRTQSKTHHKSQTSKATKAKKTARQNRQSKKSALFSPESILLDIKNHQFLKSERPLKSDCR